MYFDWSFGNHLDIEEGKMIFVVLLSVMGTLPFTSGLLNTFLNLELDLVNLIIISM